MQSEDVKTVLQRYLLLGLILLALVPCASAIAQETVLAEEDQFPVLCKLLIFDEGRIPSAGDTIKFVILTNPDYRPSVQSRDELHHAAQICPFKTIGMRPLVLIDLPYDNSGQWKSAALELGATVLYVTPQGRSNLADIITFTRTHGIISMTGVEEYVRDGVALGVGLESTRPKILLNDAGAAAEGIDFRGHVLRLARRYR
jgi:hypothetical protein